jgi:DNA-binding NarL/FixJ family response regulator
MSRTCCFAGIDANIVPMFSAVFKAAGEPALATLAHLDVSELGRLAPDLLVCDLDDVEADPRELLRRIRFVLPECMIAVYSGILERAWGRACHIAGANCLLAKSSKAPSLSAGLRGALSTGGYTDPRFAA